MVESTVDENSTETIKVVTLKVRKTVREIVCKNYFLCARSNFQIMRANGLKERKLSSTS